MIVVDASVAVKWFLPEPGEEAAQKILSGQEQLLAPALIHLEVTGAILRRFRQGDLSEQRAREGTQSWESMLMRRVLHLIPDAEIFDDAVEMAFLARHTLSDCLYLAVGKRLDAPIITADGPMRDRGLRAYGKIALLEGTERN
jgi:predicted nucleic acid-binding protein